MKASQPQQAFSLPMLPMSDHAHPCVYRPTELARMPLLYPTRRLTGEELDQQLALGRRRSGTYLYYTACPSCSACEPTRLRIEEFKLSKSMRRVLHRGDQVLKTVLSTPAEDELRLKLFNRHRMHRDLATSKEAYSREDFHGFLVDSCCFSKELSYWIGEKLVACSIIDWGQCAISAVYSYFDPDFSDLSLGTYSILKQFQLAKEFQKTFLYLGMFVESNQHLRYKGRFAPQERFIQGQWRLISEPIDDWTSNQRRPSENSSDR